MPDTPEELMADLVKHNFDPVMFGIALERAHLIGRKEQLKIDSEAIDVIARIPSVLATSKELAPYA